MFFGSLHLRMTWSMSMLMASFKRCVSSSLESNFNSSAEGVLFIVPPTAVEDDEEEEEPVPPKEVLLALLMSPLPSRLVAFAFAFCTAHALSCQRTTEREREKEVSNCSLCRG